MQRVDYYQDGMDACADGVLIHQCPHKDLTSARVQWVRGYKDFLPIRREWEQENHIRALTKSDAGHPDNVIL